MEASIKNVIKSYFSLGGGSNYEAKELTDGLSGAQVFVLAIKKSKDNKKLGNIS